MRTWFAACLLTLMCLTGVARSATDFDVPTQRIVGAEQPIAAGELVLLKVSPVENKPKHLAATSYRWRILDARGQEKRNLEQEGGVFFGAGIENTTLLAICAVTHVYIVRDADNKVTEVGARTVLLLTHVTIGGGPPPPPPPTPPPPPPPTPPPPSPLPDGRYKLAKAIYDLANKNVPATNRKQGAQALAQSFKGIASSIAAGALRDPAQILQQTTVSNLSALQRAGIQRSEWEVTFRGLQDVIFALYESRHISTADDFRAAWLEISTGLEAIP